VVRFVGVSRLCSTRTGLVGLLAALLTGVAVPSTAQDIAITNARIVIGDGSAPVDGGTVVVRGGKVVAVGAGVAVPADRRRVQPRGPGRG
jgi:hypothetical protein